MTKQLKRVGFGIAFVLFLSATAFAEKEYVQFREGFNELFGISAAGRSAGPQILLLLRLRVCHRMRRTSMLGR